MSNPITLGDIRIFVERSMKKSPKKKGSFSHPSQRGVTRREVETIKAWICQAIQ